MRWLALALVVVAVGCSSSTDPQSTPSNRCVPGAVQACPCGAQTCAADGTFGACVCADAGMATDTATGDTGTTADSSSDASSDAPVCKSGVKLTGSCRVTGNGPCVDYSTAKDTLETAKATCDGVGGTWFATTCADNASMYGWPIKGGCEFNTCGGDAGTNWTTREWCMVDTPVKCNSNCTAKGGRFLGAVL